MKISESDWKKVKKLRTEALERFAQQVLDEGQGYLPQQLGNRA